MKCARTACHNQLDRYATLIWNRPHTDQPRAYCIKCGRRIMEGNEQDTLKLKSETKPIAEVESQYPQLIEEQGHE